MAQSEKYAQLERYVEDGVIIESQEMVKHLVNCWTTSDGRKHYNWDDAVDYQSTII